VSCLLLGPIAGRVLILELVLVLVGVVLLAEILSGRWQIMANHQLPEFCLGGFWVAEVGKMMSEGGGWWGGESRRGQWAHLASCQSRRAQCPK
jgi:hypothetical protein